MCLVFLWQGILLDCRWHNSQFPQPYSETKLLAGKKKKKARQAIQMLHSSIKCAFLWEFLGIFWIKLDRIIFFATKIFSVRRMLMLKLKCSVETCQFWKKKTHFRNVSKTAAHILSPHFSIWVFISIRNVI